MSSILIHGGTIIDPSTGVHASGDVLVRDGLIEDIALGSPLEKNADRMIDAHGCLVTPGLIDPHVHLREPAEGQQHRETIAIGSAAAAGWWIHDHLQHAQHAAPAGHGRACT